MSVFYMGWIVLTAAGIIVSIGVFIWALRAGQFSDQGRARYLPLRDELPSQEQENPSGLTAEFYALVTVVVIGFSAMAGAVVLTIVRLYG